MDTGEPPENSDGSTIPYGGLGLILVVVFLLITLCYGSYIYKRDVRSQTSFITTINNNYHNDDDNHHSIRLPDDDILGTLQTFVYSELIHKGDASSDANTSGCSICLADYDGADVIRLLPECGHFFHVTCVDTWLKVHPTCPVCRNSPFPN